MLTDRVQNRVPYKKIRISAGFQELPGFSYKCLRTGFKVGYPEKKSESVPDSKSFPASHTPVCLRSGISKIL
jgi:hypothetical protein